MADKANRHPENVPGAYYVDSLCIDCDLCRQVAPSNFGRQEEKGYAIVIQQPSTPDEEKQCVEAKEGCPVEAVGNDGA